MLHSHLLATNCQEAINVLSLLCDGRSTGAIDQPAWAQLINPLPFTPSRLRQAPGFIRAVHDTKTNVGTRADLRMTIRHSWKTAAPGARLLLYTKVALCTHLACQTGWTVVSHSIGNTSHFPSTSVSKSFHSGFSAAHTIMLIQYNTSKSILMDIGRSMKDQDQAASTYLQLPRVEAPDRAYRGGIQWKGIFARLHNYLRARTITNDQEILQFCLRQLFYCADILYQQALPALTNSALATTDTTDTTDVARDVFQTPYYIWGMLQELRRVLERMESLCHLLNGTMNTMLDDLDDTTEHMSNSGDEQHEGNKEQEGNEKQRKQGVQDEQDDQDDILEQAAGDLVPFLARWQSCAQVRSPFAEQFASLLDTIPALPQMDTACQLILENAETIFAVILPAFRVIALCDDEVAMILLLDLLQKTDQMLLQITVLLPTLHALIKHYARLAHMH